MLTLNEAAALLGVAASTLRHQIANGRLGARPHIGQYLQRMLERPALQRAIAAEGLAPPLV